MTKLQETLLSYFSGALFAFAWWLWIDANVYTNYIEDDVGIYFPHYLPAIVGTIGMIMVNAVSWSDLNNNSLFSNDGVSTKARVWLFVAFIIQFGALIAAIWIGIVHWFQNEVVPKTQYGGVAIIIQNLLIFAAALIYRFAKPQEEEF